MAKQYKKRGTYTTLSEYVLVKTGKQIKDLNTYLDEYRLPGLDIMKERILRGIRNGKQFLVYGDYDVDGITSTAQLGILLEFLHANFRLRIPRRFSDGYGFNPRAVGHLDQNWILILVDNGISAIEAIDAAKQRGAEVLVLDHHMPVKTESGILLPPADLIINPAAIPDGCDFQEYCGSGLTNRLVHAMTDNEELLLRCDALAALGTVADVMPLWEDNRRIVQRGLYAINQGYATPGLMEIVSYFETQKRNDLLGHVTAESISFYLAPLLNAAGRLYDEGGTWSAMTLLERNQSKGKIFATKLGSINEARKKIVEAMMEPITIDPFDRVNFICTPDNSPTGCLGLLAGKIAEGTGRPTFVYAKENGVFKGSARSDDETKNHVKEMLDGVKDLLISYGGHPGAAGFSFAPEHELAIRNHLLQYPVTPHDITQYYDLQVTPQDAEEVLRQMDFCEPFGKAMEKPVFCMPCHLNGPESIRFIGATGDHMSISFPKTECRAVGFSLAARFKKDGFPSHMNLYGQLNWNWYRGEKRPQLMIRDYEKC